jgi:hypothetical protein
MGYAGYAPGMRVADKLTPLQQALRALPLEKAQETLELIQKLTVNVVRNPSEEKFRKIKLSNPKIAAAITEVQFAVDLLQEMGWVKTSDGDTLELPSSVRLAHEREVLALIDAKDWYKKQQDDENRRQVRARKDKSAEVEELEKKMEVDRIEKAAEGPVQHGSVANKLGDGPNIMRAGDLGIGKSSGG